MEWIASLFILLGFLLILSSTFPIIFILILRLARRRQLFDLSLDLQNFVSDNVQVIGLYSHLRLDLVNLLFLYFDLLRELDEGPVVFLLLQPDIGDLFEQLGSAELAEVLILLISLITREFFFVLLLRVVATFVTHIYLDLILIIIIKQL